MKSRSFQPAVVLLSRWLCLAVAATLLGALVARAAEDEASRPKQAQPADLVQWGTNLDWKVSAEFHDVDFDNIPLGEVVQHLQDYYDDQFDVLIPNAVPGSESGGVNPAFGLPEPVEMMQPSDVPVRLRLKNVTAPEVFRAMNMLFEMDRTPVRWDLLMFGNRPVAVLRPVEISRPSPPPASPQPPRTTGQAVASPVRPVERAVFYVGNLTDNPASGGMSLDSVLETLSTTLAESFTPVRSKLQCHKATELVIVTGPADEISFVKEVIEALGQKVSADRLRKTGSSAASPKEDSSRR